MTCRRVLVAAALAVMLFALGGPARAEEFSEISCTANCHGKEAKSLRDSVHFGALSCIDCHGGDPTALRDKDGSHAADAGFRGSLAREEIPSLCGDCHADPVRMHAFALRADQLILYRASGHGRALFERGNEKAAVCTDCHGAHGILPASDPRASTAKANLPATCGACHADPELMQASGLATDVVQQYAEGVHGRALLEEEVRGAPSCADCHGSHGAAPPGVGEVVDVCGRCHPLEKEYYQTSAHFSVPEMGCATCHGTHAIRAPGPELYAGDGPGRCGECHDDGGEAQVFADDVARGRERLVEGLAETQRLIDEGKSKGLWFEQEAVYRRESKRVLVEVLTLTHSLDAAAIAERYEKGVGRQEDTREKIAKKMSALRDRKIILSALVFLLLLLAGLLTLKLRAIRRLS